MIEREPIKNNNKFNSPGHSDQSADSTSALNKAAQIAPDTEPRPADQIGLPQAGAIASVAAGNYTALLARPGGKINRGDRIFTIIIRSIVLAVLAVMVGIFIVLVTGAAPAIGRFGPGFIVSTGWDPVKLSFGALPFIVDTLIVALIAMVLATVVGLGTAIYVTEYAPRWIQEPIAYLIELLAFIPSVVYGLWGLLVMAPWLQTTIQPWLADNLGFIPAFNGAPYGVGIMSASLILAMMLVPLVVALSREALLLVPDAQKEAMYALGATRWEVIRQAILPYARVGIAGALIISLGRALGETMAVAMTIGGGFQLPTTVLDQGYTLASIIANEINEVSSDTYLSALIFCGLILFVVTVGVNIGAYMLLQRLSGPRGLRVKG